MNKAFFRIGVSALALTAHPGLAWAQEAPEANPAIDNQQDTGDIIVTARKRNESIQSVPSVVSAVSGQLAEDLGGLQNARDAVVLVPGVTMIESANGPTAEPNIRGAGQARLPNSDAAIGLYRNGAYIVGGNLGGRSFQRFDLFDIDRIEVLRGPQGALYGRNAVGGAINVISKLPAFTGLSGEATVLGGSQKTVGGEMIVNLPLSDTFALRGGFDTERQYGGFYYNTVTNQVQDPSYYAAGRLSARYRPSSALDINFVVDYGESNNDIGETIPNPDPDGDPYAVQFNTPQRSAAKQWNFGLNVNWNLGFAQLVSTTNYRDRISRASIDNDGGNTAAEDNSFYDGASTIFQELRLQGSEHRLNWLVGADLFHLADEYDQVQSGRALIVTAAMGMTPASTVNPNIIQNTNYHQTGYAAYGSLDYGITSRLNLEAEGRYSVDEKDLLIDARRADGTPRYQDFPPGSPQTMPSGTYRNFSYGVTASYKLTPSILAFAKVATAYRSGGFNSELGNPCGVGETAGTNCNLVDVPPSYDPEHSIDYEFGLKTAWFDRALILNGNVYRVNYTDILANLNNGIMAMADPLNSAMFLANAGDAHAFGFEIEMSTRSKLPSGLGQLEFSGSVSHQEGEFTRINPSITTVLVGNDLGRLRPFSYNGNVVWRLPLGGGFKLLTAFNFVYEEGGFISAENDLNLGDTRRANLRFALQKQAYELSFKVSNLFNSQYFVNQSGTGTNGIGTSYRLNDPRSFEVALKVKW